MRTQTVEPTRWRQFLDGFTRQHRGWPISLQKAGQPDLAVDQAKLVRVAIRGRGPGRAFAVTYRIVGEPFSQSYLLRQPTEVRLERSDDQADQTLVVQGQGGGICVHFLVTAPMDVLDGLT